MRLCLSVLTPITLLFVGLSIGCGGSSTSSTSQPYAAPKHVILIIGDGMQKEHEIAASRYLTGNDYDLSFHNFPYTGACSTWDVTTYNKYAAYFKMDAYDPAAVKAAVGYDPAQGGTQPYPLGSGRDNYFLLPDGSWPATDSASAATALATGYKTDEGNLAWISGDLTTGGNRKSDGTLRTLGEIAREDMGLSIGVVSTVPFNHATPAGFVSHNTSRNNYYIGYKKGKTGIADEIIQGLKPDVVIGGGHPMLDNPSYDMSKGYISKSLHDHLKTSLDYVFVERKAGVDGSTALAQAANQAAASSKKLFGLFGGAGGNFEYHIPANNPGSPSVVRGNIENPDLKTASLAALKVLSRNPRGLFLMIEQGDIDWANHANGYRDMVGCVHDLNEAVKAVEAYVDQPGDVMDWSNTLVIVTSDHGNSFMRLNDKATLGQGQMPTDVSPFVNYGSSGHTNELVSLYAKGPASALAALHAKEGLWYDAPIVDNTHLFHVMTDFMGLHKSSPLSVSKTPKPVLEATPTALTLAKIGGFNGGAVGASEITAFDPASKRLFVVNGANGTVDVLDLTTPSSPVSVGSISVTSLGSSVNSVAVKDGLVALAIQANVKTDPGVVAFYNAADLAFLHSVTVGALPDMLTFTPDGKKVLVANEGEPNSYGQGDSVDPEGSISIITVNRTGTSTVVTANFTAFNSQVDALRAQGIRIYGPNATVAQDLEPEYITVSPDGAKAYVTLQENNALAEVNLGNSTITKLMPLGLKDYNALGAGLDASDEDGGTNTNSGTPTIKIANYPVKGMYQPDAIASFNKNGVTYLVTANEGDAREYTGFEEEVRVRKHYTPDGLDATLFPDGTNLLFDSNLGRLKVTSTPNFGQNGKNDTGKGTGIFSFGGRSFSIWRTNGTQVFDSGNDLEQRTKALPNIMFNASNDNNDLDSRSPGKGPEPEGVVIGTFGDKVMAFVGLERVGGIMVYDVTNPEAPVFVTYVNPRDGATGDRGPEGLTLIKASESPNGNPLLVVGNETSGTTAIYQINLTY